MKVQTAVDIQLLLANIRYNELLKVQTIMFGDGKDDTNSANIMLLAEMHISEEQIKSLKSIVETAEAG